MNMNDFKGTPSPWEVGSSDLSIGQDNITVDAPHEKRAFVAILIDYEGMPVHANAALIAASPDLLKACQDALELIEFLDSTVVSQKKLDALNQQLTTAITKALTI